jgi:hypothetical protein
LQDAESHSEAHTAAPRFGGVKEGKDLLAVLRGNAHPLVGDLQLQAVGPGAGHDLQLAPGRHGLASVEHQVEEGLLHQVAVHVDRRKSAIALEHQPDAILPRLRLGESEDLTYQVFDVRLAGMDFDGPREIEEGLHHAVEAPDFRREDVQLGSYPRALVGEFGLQDFQLQDHGVKRVLHLVGDAGSEPAEGRQFGGNVDLVLDLRPRAGVAQRDQASHALPLGFDKLDADRHTRRVLTWYFDRMPGKRLPGAECFG